MDNSVHLASLSWSKTFQLNLESVDTEGREMALPSMQRSKNMKGGTFVSVIRKWLDGRSKNGRAYLDVRVCSVLYSNTSSLHFPVLDRGPCHAKR